MMNGASLTNDEHKGSFRNLKGDGAIQGPPNNSNDQKKFSLSRCAVSDASQRKRTRNKSLS